ncbi:hypothetical protein [Mycolicibacterium sp. YH-1]|uniref:hypothetical protein n=1 Tax=Mycolicibacterium sp. YH-1 TaxID=2908837 RepID=UPI001F4C192D|nr:hypothetical protein [Mycolicibacterium sp. YH-1]UNB50257.1 hypothetical protein L0M16_19945 [Mycolicibacterium sp. YH-1]
MTAPGAADLGGYPAPGSTTPGAPPPLKRALTPADGVPAASVSGEAVIEPSVPRAHSGAASVRAVPSRAGSRLVAAAAMFGVAAGLEIAGVLSQSRHR